jgi:hypothetical protein
MFKISKKEQRERDINKNRMLAKRLASNLDLDL